MRQAARGSRPGVVPAAPGGSFTGMRITVVGAGICGLTVRPHVLTYAVPREHTLVLGGTADEGEGRTEPDPPTARAVLQRCAALVPAVAGARVLEHKVGLRPARPSIRVDAGRLASGQPVVHNYGHGGAGMALSYGWAQDVVRLAEAA